MKRKPVKRKPVLTKARYKLKQLPVVPTFAMSMLKIVTDLTHHFTILEITLEQMRDRQNETNERLRVIEADIEKIQVYIGVLARKQ